MMQQMLHRHGFTGTQSPGPMAKQRVQDHLIALPKNLVLVVGCCIGMDTLIAHCARDMGFTVHGVVPANRYKVDPWYKVYCNTYEEMPEGTSYMQRNDRLVELATVGFTGFPKTAVEELHSGTWATIRRARRKFDIVTIIPVGDE